MATKNNGRGDPVDPFGSLRDALLSVEAGLPADKPNRQTTTGNRPVYNLAPVLPQVPPSGVPASVLDVNLGRKTQARDPRAVERGMNE